MKLCKYLGGSTLYGLNTPTSDIDYRGVYLNTDPLEVYGFHRNDSVVKQTNDVDLVEHEFTQFLRLAYKSNTQTLECLFAPIDSFTELTSKFKHYVLDHKYKLIDSEVLFKSLRGYLHNEMRLAIGERTGLLGSKRKNQLEEHGFSPKNFSHLIRLAFCGQIFFTHGTYPVRVKEYCELTHELCYNIKVNPSEFKKAELVQLSGEYEEAMVNAFENRSMTLKPDENYIRFLLSEFYGTI
jgi:predicted nucleotidyltransferase